MNRLARIVEEATLLEEVRECGGIQRTTTITVVRSEALRHVKEIVLILLGEGISLQPDMTLSLRGDDMARQFACLGLSANQFIRLLAILKDLGQDNPFAPPTTFVFTANVLLETLPEEELDIPMPTFRSCAGAF